MAKDLLECHTDETCKEKLPKVSFQVFSQRNLPDFGRTMTNQLYEIGKDLLRRHTKEIFDLFSNFSQIQTNQVAEAAKDLFRYLFF